MARIFITGSTDGLGLMAAQLLLENGHQVVLHARDDSRAQHVLEIVPGAESVVTGDLSSIDATIKVADQVNALGNFDAIIHNAGVGYRERCRVETVDGLPHVFAINVMAPYVLTSLVQRPKRLVYLSSGMHRGASEHLDDVMWTSRPWSGETAYSESKLYDVLLSFAVARLWRDVQSNALEPGWVPTKMGGPGAPDDLSKAHLTQAWLARGEDPAACVSGEYFYHMRPRRPDPATRDIALQNRLLHECERLSGVKFPV